MYSSFGSSGQAVMMTKAYQAEQRRIAAQSRLAAQSRARRSRRSGGLPGLLAAVTPRARPFRSSAPKVS